MKLRPYQKEGVRQIYKFRGRAILGDDMGLGKALAITEPVLTPDGWRAIGTLKVGDLVIGSDGRPCRVTGVFPQGTQSCFYVQFRDGARVVASSDHLWMVRSGNDDQRSLPYRILDTNAIRKSGLTWGKNHVPKWEVPLMEPCQFSNRLSIDPYLLGSMLGNGSFTSRPSISISHKEQVRIIEKILPDGMYISGPYPSDPNKYGLSYGYGRKNPLTRALRSLGLWGLIDHKKHIPSVCFRLDQKSRLSLLQGLLDTDGTTANGRTRFGSTSRVLAEGVRQLVLSLGGVAVVNGPYPPNDRAKMEMWFTTVFFLDGTVPFRLKYHIRRYRPSRKRMRRFISSISYAGLRDCTCISVDSPDQLFVTRDYVLTHNTIQALSWISRLPRRRPVVIVCPSGVKYNWQAEAATHFGLKTEVLESRTPRPIPGNIIILNYDILRYWLKTLLKLKPSIVIFDEAHYLQSVDSDRTTASFKLARKAASVLTLSGTPFTNRLIDLWPVINITRPDIYPYRLSYAWRYCRPRKTRWGWKFDGARRTKELRRTLLEECLIRRLKKNVAKEIPDKTYKAVLFRLDRKDFAEYERARKDIVKWLKVLSPARAKRAKRNKALVKVGYLLRLCAALKLDLVTKWLRDLAAEYPGEKIVALTMNTFVIEHLRKEFPNCVVVNGAVTGRKRTDSVRQFQSNKKTQWFFGQWKAAGAGLNLQASRLFVALDLPWTPGDFAQGPDRLHRIGQTRKVMIYCPLLLNTIEKRLLEILRSKRSVQAAVLDGGRSVDEDIVDSLLEELERSEHKPRI